MFCRGEGVDEKTWKFVLRNYQASPKNLKITAIIWEIKILKFFTKETFIKFCCVFPIFGKIFRMIHSLNFKFLIFFSHWSNVMKLQNNVFLQEGIIIHGFEEIDHFSWKEKVNLSYKLTSSGNLVTFFACRE